jgi:hypothetical protein
VKETPPQKGNKERKGMQEKSIQKQLGRKRAGVLVMLSRMAGIPPSLKVHLYT